MTEFDPLMACCAICGVMLAFGAFLAARLIEFTLEDMRRKLKRN